MNPPKPAASTVLGTPGRRPFGLVESEYRAYLWHVDRHRRNGWRQYLTRVGAPLCIDGAAYRRRTLARRGGG